MGAYTEQAKQARLKVLDLIYEAQASHIGSNFSCIDILTVLFDKIDLDKDRFVLSAGWKAASLYYFLWKKGRITVSNNIRWASGMACRKVKENIRRNWRAGFFPLFRYR